MKGGNKLRDFKKSFEELDSMDKIGIGDFLPEEMKTVLDREYMRRQVVLLLNTIDPEEKEIGLKHIYEKYLKICYEIERHYQGYLLRSD